MKPRTASRLAWSVGTVSIAMMVGALVLMFVDRHAVLPSIASSDHWNFADVLNVVVNLAAISFGIVLASRRRGNAIGWMFLGAGLALAVGTFGTAYGVHALVVDPGSLPAGRLLAWLGSWPGLIALGTLPFLFLLFPTGHVLSRRWRPVAWFVGCAFLPATATIIIFSVGAWTHPYNQPSSGSNFPFLFVFILPIVTALLLSLVALVVRFRRSTGDERLQLKWFVTAATLVVAAFIPGFFSSSSSPAPLISVLQSLALVFLFSAIVIAVLRYRLYEIDVVISKAVVYGVLAAFFTAVYLAVVVGIGATIGSKRNPFLTILAAAVIALAFNPVRNWAKRFANRIVYGDRATPYEVLSEFSERMAGTYSQEDVLPRMARILCEGTGAARAQVWLRIGNEIRPATSWGEPGGNDRTVPVIDEDLPAMAEVSKAVAVRHQGDVLGALTVTKPPNEPLTAAEGKLVDDLAAQAGLVLRNVRLTEELRANLNELRASRQRIVAAQDSERRRLERNIHDGAQQQLVALTVKLRLLEQIADRDPAQTKALATELQAESTGALENIRDLARGIYPPLLADKGLATALESQARKAAVPVSVEADGIGRYPEDAEAAVYFSCLEGLQNVAKYADASRAVIRVSHADGELSFEVEDDGRGFDSEGTTYGTGLQGIADRLAALDGTLEVRSTPGAGATLRGRVPV
jgi:signal transduction histidine kinase